jgi:hypothetical protein
MEVSMIDLKQVFTVLVIFLLTLSTTLSAQTRLGTDLDGEAAYDESGGAVTLSANGKYLAVGARNNDGNGFDAGHVRVYHWTGTAWAQLGADIDGEAPYDESGGFVSLSSDGKRLAIGARNNDGNGFDSGHVRVYQWTATAWAQMGSDINGEAAYDESGGSVSLCSDGHRLAIGARKNDGNGFDSGHVRVYQWTGAAWAQMGSDINGEAAYDESGASVSLSADGSRLAIGADKNDGNGIDSGHVRVYQWSGTTWSQLGADINGEAFGDHSGQSVSLSQSGERLAIGAPFNVNSHGTNSGHVRVYQWSGAAWTKLGADIDGEAAYDESGGSVSLAADGNHLAIGAAKNDGNGIDSGQARVYRWSGTAWTQIGVDLDGETFGDGSGHSISLSAYSNRLAIGAPLNDGNGQSAGHARVYDFDMFNAFRINAGLNDAWYNPLTDGQGFFINVFPDFGVTSLAWFTYDTELPPEDAQSNLGDPGHRWLTAIGPITGNQVTMDIEMTSGGLFDTPTEIQRTDPPGSDGTIVLTFYSCNTGTVEYDIPSINRKGTVYIRRVANDNIVLCEALDTE